MKTGQFLIVSVDYYSVKPPPPRIGVHVRWYFFYIFIYFPICFITEWLKRVTAAERNILRRTGNIIPGFIISQRVPYKVDDYVYTAKARIVRAQVISKPLLSGKNAYNFIFLFEKILLPPLSVAAKRFRESNPLCRRNDVFLFHYYYFIIFFFRFFSPTSPPPPRYIGGDDEKTEKLLGRHRWMGPADGFPFFSLYRRPAAVGAPKLIKITPVPYAVLYKIYIFILLKFFRRAKVIKKILARRIKKHVNQSLSCYY